MVLALLQAAGVAATLLLASDCSKASSSGPTPIPPFIPPPTAPVFVGAGDIGQCPGAAASTAALIDAIPGMVFTTGDDVYGGATLAQYQSCYGPTWGRFLDRTRPVPGNHDYNGAAGLSAYFQYLQGSSGPESGGYYSYDYQGWHIVALNSVSIIRGDSAQMNWLEADLSASSAKCTIAYWHHPLFSSSSRNPATNEMRQVWNVLYAHNVDIVLNGHDHSYERFDPQDPTGRLDLARGIVEFVVGTGGADLYSFGIIQPNSRVQASTYGVLKLTLESAGYAYEFVPAGNTAFHDRGQGICH